MGKPRVFGSQFVAIGTENPDMITESIKDMPLRSPVMRIDYTGHHAHCLVELADSLPAQLYAPKLLK